MFGFLKAIGQRSRISKSPESLRIVLITKDREFTARMRDVAAANRWGLELYQNCEHAIEGRRRGGNAMANLVIYDWPGRGEEWRTALTKLAAAQCGASILLASPVVDTYLRAEVVDLHGFDALPRSGSSEAIAHAIRFAWFATRHTTA